MLLMLFSGGAEAPPVFRGGWLPPLYDDEDDKRKEQDAYTMLMLSI
jgi:hypothetical protein